MRSCYLSITKATHIRMTIDESASQLPPRKKKVSGNQWIRISLFFGWARGGGRKGCAVCTFCSVPTHNRFVVCPFSILFFSRCGRPPFDMCVREIRLTALCVLRKFSYIILRVYVYSIADLESFSGCPSLSSAL